MRERCNRPTHPMFKYYGGKGISVCERWNSFADFLADMGRKPSRVDTIDRINGSGNYEPANCRWATPLEQNLNRPNVYKITIGDRTESLRVWCEENGITLGAAYQRMSKVGMSPEEAVTRPMDTRRKARKSESFACKSSRE